MAEGGGFSGPFIVATRVQMTSAKEQMVLMMSTTFFLCTRHGQKRSQ